MSLALRTCSSLICGGLLLMSIGCATLQLPFGKDRMQKATVRNPVVQIVCIWEPSQGRDPSGMPCRGFAGQILFLAGRNSLPVQVEGDVRIYLFDDQGTPDEQTKPMHQYDFDSRSWERHLTQGTLGPTYSVFVPYTRRGFHEAKCALRVRLKSGDQVAVFSDMASIPLDGRTTKTSDIEGQVPTVEEAKAATEAVSQTMRRTTTISMNGETAKPNAKAGRMQSESLATPAKEASGRVQLANYEVGAEPIDPETRRIEQLEQLVQQMLEQQQEMNKETARREEPNPATATAPAESLEPSRHRLTKRQSGEPSTDSVRAVRPSTLHEEDSESTESTTTPAPLTSEAHTRHPLSDFDGEDTPQPIRTAARPRREPVSNHPLAALDEELSREDAFMQPARKPQSQPIVKTREESAPIPRTIRAAEQRDHRERSWSDAFEPIDTDAMETTSVEADTIRRQRLRAAR